MIIFLHCAPAARLPVADYVSAGEQFVVYDLPEVPGRSDLVFLDELSQRFVVGDVASVDQIARRPDVAHLGHPVADPHPVSQRVRVVVYGGDAALAAVATRLMRSDSLWVELAYVPWRPGESSVVTVWGLNSEVGCCDSALRFAMTAPARPTVLIRDDYGVVTLGMAEVTGASDDAAGRCLVPFVGEVLVDSTVIYSWCGEKRQARRLCGVRRDRAPHSGVRVVPMYDCPGLAAVRRPVVFSGGVLSKCVRLLFAGGSPVPSPVVAGRAMQAGGVDMRVVRDGVVHPRLVKSVTFYRHLRDGQFVRN